MSEHGPAFATTYIATETRTGEIQVWRNCGVVTCSTFHGPIATCPKPGDAQTIVDALNAYARSRVSTSPGEATSD
jgi:hypothetical protein